MCQVLAARENVRCHDAGFARKSAQFGNQIGGWSVGPATRIALVRRDHLADERLDAIRECPAALGGAWGKHLQFLF
jgi:hypothetical protein